MDLSGFVSASVAGVPLVFVVLVLVYLAGKIGAQGWVQTVCSAAVGLVLGCGYMVTQTRPPTADAWLIYVYWFSVAVYGLALGGLASLLYDQAKAIIEKMIAGLLEKITRA